VDDCHATKLLKLGQPSGEHPLGVLEGCQPLKGGMISFDHKVMSNEIVAKILTEVDYCQEFLHCCAVVALGFGECLGAVGNDLLLALVIL
jgi:hypothetical protein